MGTVFRSLSGALIGAAAMYWFDPSSGRRRRIRLRDQLLSDVRHLRSGLDVGGRDLTNRMHGLAARARSLTRDGSAPDDVLTERVRSALGRVVSHPGAIEVSVTDGRVTLSGPVLAEEYSQLLRTARSVRGVRDVQDRLAVYEEPTGVPALQGGHPRHPPRFELLQENWAPGPRLVVGTIASALLLLGLRSRGLGRALATATGGALMARTATNMPLARLIGAKGRGVNIHKTIHVNAPVEQVFGTVSYYENYPLFTRNVRSVHMHPDGRSRWCVAGPAGIPVEWDAVTTAYEPNRLIAWRTVPHAAVKHSGILRIEPYNGGTRLEIDLSYNPPGGVLGHAVAKLFGCDPKNELDQDMLRLKTFLETGKTPHDAAARAAAVHLAGQVPRPAEAAQPLREPQPLH